MQPGGGQFVEAGALPVETDLVGARGAVRKRDVRRGPAEPATACVVDRLATPSATFPEDNRRIIPQSTAACDALGLLRGAHAIACRIRRIVGLGPGCPIAAPP